MGNQLSRPMLTNKKIYDAVVVGSGLAGLTASLELLAKGYSVALIEKTERLGGNSAKASSGINGVPTKFQDKSDGDSVSSFVNDTIKSGKGLSDPELVDVLTSNSADAIHWLSDIHGVDLSSLTALGGHSHARTHRGSGKLPPGFAITSALSKKLHESNVDIMTSSKLLRFLKEDSEVVGIEVEVAENGKRSVLAHNVVLATGGFSADFTSTSSLLRRYRPDLLHLPLTNGQQTTGDGQKIAERDLNAKLIHMDQIQVHPTGFVQLKDDSTVSSKWKFLCGELIRGIGGILLSLKSGERFVDELRTRDEVTSHIISHCTTDEDNPAIAAIVVGEEDYKKAKSHIDFYVSQQLMFKGGVSDLLEKLRMVENHSISKETVKQTLDKYNKVRVSGDSLGRSNFGNNIDDTFYFGFITPVLHFAMGGIQINENGQVIGEDGPLLNVFAIGEVSGGVHGGNRLGGSSLLECVVFGRRVAKHIAQDDPTKL